MNKKLVLIDTSWETYYSLNFQQFTYILIYITAPTSYNIKVYINSGSIILIILEDFLQYYFPQLISKSIDKLVVVSDISKGVFKIVCYINIVLDILI